MHQIIQRHACTVHLHLLDDILHIHVHFPLSLFSLPDFIVRFATMVLKALVAMCVLAVLPSRKKVIVTCTCTSLFTYIYIQMCTCMLFNTLYQKYPKLCTCTRLHVHVHDYMYMYTTTCTCKFDSIWESLA